MTHDELMEVLDLSIRSEAQGVRLYNALRKTLQRHRPFNIVDEDESEKILYTVCKNCCTYGPSDYLEQSENCANHHTHGEGIPICLTIDDIEKELPKEPDMSPWREQE